MADPDEIDKISIIGAGEVGATIGYALMIKGVASEIVLIDINQEKAKGEAMDINHGASFVPPVTVNAGDYTDCKNADIIIIAAGASQEPGETRLDLVEKNTEIFKQIIPQVSAHNQDGILLIVTNPVDILTYVAYQISDFPQDRVIGSGTVLDSSRFRSLISRSCEVAANNVHGYIIGEHGDSEVPVWSLTNIAGANLNNYCPVCKEECEAGSSKQEIENQVKNAAYEIIDKKGATYYAIALAVTRIARAILRNENAVLTVSTLMEGYYGIEDVCLSLPTVLNNSGVKKVLRLPLNSTEKQAFIDSANTLKETINQLNL